MNKPIKLRRQFVHVITNITNLGSLPGRILDRTKSIKSHLFHNDAFVILRAVPITELSELESICLHKIENPAVIHEVYESTGRRWDNLERIIENRLRNGYSFCAFYEENELIFTTWIIHDGERFIDEIAISIKLRDKSIFIRDAYCVQGSRGKGYFKRVLKLIISEYYPDALSIYSDTEKSNESSIRAHQNCGFAPIFSIRYFRILNKFLIRTIEDNDMEIDVYQEDKHIVPLNSNFKSYVYENLGSMAALTILL